MQLSKNYLRPCTTRRTGILATDCSLITIVEGTVGALRVYLSDFDWSTAGWVTLLSESVSGTRILLPRAIITKDVVVTVPLTLIKGGSGACRDEAGLGMISPDLGTFSSDFVVVATFVFF